MPTTLCTFNVNNLFARYKFWKTFPGDMSKKSLTGDPAFGYLPFYDKRYLEIFNPQQRELEGLAISRNNTAYPDVLVLEEVESLLALRRFNELYLGGTYPYAMLVDSRDYRQIDVGILSRHPLLCIRSHVDDPDPEGGGSHPYLFSRDCLEIDIVPQEMGGRRFTLFVNHLKSKFAESEEETQESDALRERQAQAVCEIVHQRFPGPEFDTALFAVMGDLNDEPGSGPLKPLVKECGLSNAIERIPDKDDRWTHWYRSENSVSQFDYILLSPELDRITDGAVPEIERRGISFSRVLADGRPGPKMTKITDPDSGGVHQVPFQFERFAGVSVKDYASDHCPVFFTLP